MHEIPEYLFSIRDDLLDTEDLFLPKQGEPDATGFDVRAAQTDRKPIIVKSGEYCKIPLGFRVYCPPGWWYQLHPRSSSFLKRKMHSLIGIIDEAYPTEVAMVFQYIPDSTSLCNDLIINFGDAIGQIIPIKRQLMKTKLISNNDIDKKYKERNAVRNGGFGSTDKK